LSKGNDFVTIRVEANNPITIALDQNDFYIGTEDSSVKLWIAAETDQTLAVPDPDITTFPIILAAGDSQYYETDPEPNETLEGDGTIYFPKVELKATDNHSGGGWASPDLEYAGATCTYQQLGMGRYYHSIYASIVGARPNDVTLSANVISSGTSAAVQWSGVSLSGCEYNPGTSAAGNIGTDVVVYHQASPVGVNGIPHGSHTFKCTVGIPNSAGTGFSSVLCEKDVVVNIVETTIDHVPDPVLRQQDIDVPIDVTYSSPANVKVVSGNFVAKYNTPPAYTSYTLYDFSCLPNFVVPYGDVEYAGSTDVNGTATRYTLFTNMALDDTPKHSTESLVFQSKNLLHLVDSSGTQMTEDFESSAGAYNNQITYTDNNINTMTPWERDGATWVPVPLQTFATAVGGRSDSRYYKPAGSSTWSEIDVPWYFDYSTSGYGNQSAWAWVGWEDSWGPPSGSQEEVHALHARNGYCLVGWPRMRSPYTSRFFLHEPIMAGRKVTIETGAFFNDSPTSGALTFYVDAGTAADPWAGVPADTAGWLLTGYGAVAMVYPPLGVPVWAGLALTAGGTGIELLSHEMNSPGGTSDTLEARARMQARVNGGTPFINAFMNTSGDASSGFGPAVEQDKTVDIGANITWGIEIYCRANNEVGTGEEDLYTKIKYVTPDLQLRMKAKSP